MYISINDKLNCFKSMSDISLDLVYSECHGRVIMLSKAATLLSNLLKILFIIT